jgi:hypothetical protein
MDGLPLVLVGDTRSKTNLEILQANDWGRMVVTKRPAPYPFEKWGFDNGVFAAWLKGLPFPETDFLRRLEVAEKVNSEPYIAVTPDIVAGGCMSLQFSTSWRMSHRLPSSWPWYLAVQDGMTPDDVKPHLHLYAGLFLGGTNRFKATAYRWRVLAHQHRMKFHYGRASTPGKLVSAFKCGADSVDSAFPLWTAERMRIFVARWQGLAEQSCIPDMID